ncbi:MAG: hypothetical protein V1738_02235 [Patescibacteria group bacterium]
MDELKIYPSLDEDNPPENGSHQVRSIGGYLLQVKEVDGQVRFDIIGEEVGQPFVFVRYRGEDGQVVRAELSLEGEAAKVGQRLSELLDKVKVNRSRCRLVPFLRGMVDRIETLTIGVRYRPILENLRPQVLRLMSQKLRIDEKHIGFTA